MVSLGMAVWKRCCPPVKCSGWWFGTFFIFPYIGNNHPNWLIFFRGVQTTNQCFLIVRPCTMRCSFHRSWHHLTPFTCGDCRDAHWILSFCGQVVEVLQKAGAEDGWCAPFENIHLIISPRIPLFFVFSLVESWKNSWNHTIEIR